MIVLYRQYLEESRGGDGQTDTFTAKAQRYKQELDDLLDRVVIHWAGSPGEDGSDAPTTRLSTRLSR